jgi:hypothetical protein
MKNLIGIGRFFFFLSSVLFISCEDYLEVEVPDQKIISKTIFDNEVTAQSAMVGLYNQLSDLSFSSGGRNSVTVLAGLSADNLSPIYETTIPMVEFDQHEISLDNNMNFQLWSSAYNIIYTTNSLLEGIQNSDHLSEEVKNKLEGESKFVRAFTYFYLVNLYGDVPLVTTTDYQENALTSKTSKEVIYNKIIEDLTDASLLLNEGYSSGERTQVNKLTAFALLARVQLYLQNWEEAINKSSEVIGSNHYQLLSNPNEVFLKNSKEAIWQFSPVGRGLSLTNTPEGGTFIIDPFWYFLAEFKLNEEFVQSFNSQDERLASWIGLSEELGVYFPYKYKINNSTEEATEYSMVMRLAEQYLIRAEAKAKMGDMEGAIADLNMIRIRAGLKPVEEVEQNIDQDRLLSLIMQDRNKELFTEWGHRWLDLRRTDKTEEEFSSSIGWESTDIYYPIPESELMKNSNLTQNEGY